MYWAIGAVVFLIALFLFLSFPKRARKQERDKLTGRYYAHRGYHDNEKGLPPENSLEAFALACDNGYGMELDIQFTKDKQIVVFHDNEYARVCGVEKKVWELTYDEARELRLCGRDYRVPLFSDVLKTVGGRTPIIVEVKAESRAVADYEELCAAAWELLKDYKGDYCVESFHPLVVRWWKKNHPEIVRGQLAYAFKRYNEGFMIGFLLSTLMSSFMTRPHFIAYHEREAGFLVRLNRFLGSMTVAWTCRSLERAKQLERTSDAIIFEGFAPTANYEIR